MIKYVLANEGDVLVDGVPNSAQTVKFLTGSHTDTCSAQKNIYYITEDQLQNIMFPPDQVMIIPLADNLGLRRNLVWKFGFQPEEHSSFTVYKKFINY